jgi:hypothetical protein
VATSGQVSASTPCIRRWNRLKQPALIEGAGIDDHVVARVEDAAGFPATDRQPLRTGDDDVEGHPIPSPASGVQACDLEVPAGIEETGVLRRTIRGLDPPALAPARLAERSGGLDGAQARLWGRLFDVVDE